MARRRRGVGGQPGPRGRAPDASRGARCDEGRGGAMTGLEKIAATLKAAIAGLVERLDPMQAPVGTSSPVFDELQKVRAAHFKALSERARARQAELAAERAQDTVGARAERSKAGAAE